MIHPKYLLKLIFIIVISKLTLSSGSGDEFAEFERDPDVEVDSEVQVDEIPKDDSFVEEESFVEDVQGNWSNFQK